MDFLMWFTGCLFNGRRSLIKQPVHGVSHWQFPKKGAGIFSVVLLFLFLQLSLSGQVILINEIMSSNSVTVADEEGDFSDWIELVNTGKTMVSLKGWGLSDDPGDPFKWVFPERKIMPGQYLVVWASGKDYRPAEGEWINGIMREVYANIAGTSISSLTKHSSYPDTPASRCIIKDCFEAPVNEGNNYGQRMHGFIKAPATGYFIFWISSDDNSQLWLSRDTSRANLQMIAEVTGWTYSRAWDTYAKQKSAPVFLEKGRFYYIRALAKDGTGSDNLAVGWQWPDGTRDLPVSGKHIFWPAGQLHTNFSISAEGEEIVLSSPGGAVVDKMPPVGLSSGLSYGRVSRGSHPYGFFTVSTPGEANRDSSYSEVLSPPVFSHTGGFYHDPFNLSLSTREKGVTIVYTLDGSLPDPENLKGTSYPYKNKYPKNPGSEIGPFLYRSYKSHLYDGPLQIRDNSGEENQVSRISTTYDITPAYFPEGNIEKAVVVKARACKAGALSSPVVAHTYFVRNGSTQPYPLPVFSVSADEDEFFDFYKGIYVAGVDFENWRTAHPSDQPTGGTTANYHRDGDEWEYPAYLEFFDFSGNRALAGNIGYRIHGAYSRAQPFKSIRIYARSEYGEKNLEYPFFENQGDEAFKRIVLRNSGNDIRNTLFRDAAMHEMVRHMNFETQAYQPSILFINGEYWGIHNIRERVDKYYLARKFGVNENQLDILEDNMSVDEGDKGHYVETINYLTTHGVQDTSDYEFIRTRIDVNSFMDYMIAEIFMVNTDWPGNNIKYWRLQTPEYLPGEGEGRDGRWRWILFDTDNAFGNGNSGYFSYDMMTFATKSDGTSWPNPSWATLLFRKLLENEEFKTSFIVRFTDQLNTAFRPEVVRSLISRLQSGIEPEMERHIYRWKMPASILKWKSNLNVLYTFAEQRPGYARSHLRSFFNLSSDYLLTIDVSGSNQGHVVVNTIPLLSTTRGVDENTYPWKGTYFRHVPLRLEAVPAAGYEFVRWESGSVFHTDPVIQLKPGGNQNFKAIFKMSSIKNQLVHYWSFNETDRLLVPTFTLLSAAINPELSSGGSAALIPDEGEGFSGINARLGKLTGGHLRVNNPLGAALLFTLPSTGFSALKFSYETRRSGKGAGTQVVEYSADNSGYREFRRITVKDDDPELVVLDFSKIIEANNNPGFKIRIRFLQGSGGTAGNNRFDNVTLEGIPAGHGNPGELSPDPGSIASFGEGEVYPNPFRSHATLHLRLLQEEQVQAVIYDISGRVVFRENWGLQPAGDVCFTIRGNALPAGVYFLVCTSETGIFRHKLVKY